MVSTKSTLHTCFSVPPSYTVATFCVHLSKKRLFLSFSPFVKCFSSPLFLQSAFAFVCIDVPLLLKVSISAHPLHPSFPPPSSSALRCVIYESACWPVNVSPSILCSTPSELIRLWRAIYPPLKERESANFSSSSPPLPYSHYIWTSAF